MRTWDLRLHSRGGFAQRAKLFLAHIFPEHEIVLRTGLRRRRLVLSTGLQATVALAAIGTTVWQSLVTTQWLDSSATIARKDYEIVDLQVDRAAAIESMTSSENRFGGLATRISTEIEDIQRNLALLARHDDMTSTSIAQYPSSSGKSAKGHAGRPLSPGLDEKLARLEESLRSLKSRHSELLATSAQTASVQLDRLASALATVGIDTGALVADLEPARDAAAEPDACASGELGCGGPFVPLNDWIAREAPPEAMEATMRRWDDLIGAMSQLPLGAPVENMHMSSGFGRRLDPFHHRPAVHAGLDFAGTAYSPVLATGGGVVSYSDSKGAYGRLVEIDHGHGFFTRYAHLAEVSVTVGQKIERGTVVGLVGSTGRSTGPHLHYELRVGNQPRDPLKFIGVGKNVFKRDNEDAQG